MSGRCWRQVNRRESGRDGKGEGEGDGRDVGWVVSGCVRFGGWESETKKRRRKRSTMRKGDRKRSARSRIANRRK